MRFRPLFCSLVLSCPLTLAAQQPPTQPGQTSTPSQTTPTLPPSAIPGSSNPTQTTAPGQVIPVTDPYVIEDGGFTIEPIYWFNRAQPQLYGGLAATSYGNYDFTGQSKNAIGGEISLPAGAQNTLRVSYFRVQGDANQTFTQATTIFGEAYSDGDYVSGGYRLQDYKVSWDYLSYNWRKRAGTLRLKTLYEVQFVTISTQFVAPFKAVTEDSSGNTDYNTASGSKNIIYPTLGLELEQQLGHHFRWELKGSGFGLPHHASIWDTEGTVAYRVGAVEVLAGEKAFHFKTGPHGSEYFADTLSGAYVGVRYYWGSTVK